MTTSDKAAQPLTATGVLQKVGIEYLATVKALTDAGVPDDRAKGVLAVLAQANWLTISADEYEELTELRDAQAAKPPTVQWDRDALIKFLVRLRFPCGDCLATGEPEFIADALLSALPGLTTATRTEPDAKVAKLALRITKYDAFGDEEMGIHELAATLAREVLRLSEPTAPGAGWRTPPEKVQRNWRLWRDAKDRTCLWKSSGVKISYTDVFNCSWPDCACVRASAKSPSPITGGEVR